jgi:hypothetical protein
MGLHRDAVEPELAARVREVRAQARGAEAGPLLPGREQAPDVGKLERHVEVDPLEARRLRDLAVEPETRVSRAALEVEGPSRGRLEQLGEPAALLV